MASALNPAVVPLCCCSSVCRRGGGATALYINKCANDLIKMQKKYICNGTTLQKLPPNHLQYVVEKLQNLYVINPGSEEVL